MAEKHISQEACEWREVGGLETNCSAGDFLSGVDVWITRPQVVNRRLLGAVTVGGSGPRQEGGAGQLPRGAGGSLEEGEDDVVVRELLPRARSMEPRKEVVTTRYSEEDPVNLHNIGFLTSPCVHYKADCIVSQISFKLL